MARARSWCRLPLPGLGVELLRRHRLDPARTIMVGTSAADRTFARRLGLSFVPADEFFEGGDGSSRPESVR